MRGSVESKKGDLYVSSALKEKIIDELDTLTEPQLAQILRSVQSVRSQTGSGATVGEMLEKFGGSIPADELDRMERAIEEDCERIESD